MSTVSATSFFSWTKLTRSSLLAETISLFEQGFIKPIEPMKVFEGAMIEDSFRYMQKGQHIGKIVVKIPSSQVPETLPVTKKIQPLMLNSQGAYLLVGGLGGLGRAISNWMVECGARNIVYLSRSAGKSEEDQQFFKELESQGCSVQAVAGDVTKLQDVQGVVANAIRPIVGVLQLSMVLRDGPFLKMSHEDWKAATEPKVLGTWNLHHALINTKLDFFVLFSSGSGLFGWTHQANYASGNTFLDAFVQYRLSQGFPASVLDVGVMSEIGYVSKTPIVEEALRASSNYSLQEKDLIDALHLVIAESSCTAKSQTPGSFVSHEQLAIGLRSTRPIGEPGNRLPWRRDARTAVYHANESSVHSTSSNSSDALDAFIASITSDRTLLNSEASLELVTREIGSCIYGFMLRPIEDLDVAQPLTDLGIDSLITVEIRNWWRRKLGVEISTLEILNGGTIASLGQLAVKRLQEKFALKVQ
jgi:acyl carrier protein